MRVDMKRREMKNEGERKKGTKREKIIEYIYGKKMSKRRIKVSENVNWRRGRVYVRWESKGVKGE